MKRILLIALLFVAATSLAVAQKISAPTTDVLGAHLMYGRGCIGCHAPHGGPKANGGTTNTGSGGFALWGEDTSALSGQPFAFGDGSTYTYTAGTLSDGSVETTGILTCLSCHDGNLTTVAMMKGTSYEAVTLSNGTTTTTVHPPTLLGADGGYHNDHPVGQAAVWAPASTYTWAGTTISSRGKIVPAAATAAYQFQQDYGFFVTFGTGAVTGEVLCTTCHNQHNMSAVSVSSSNSGMAAGTYSTMFFLVGPYSPNSTTVGANSPAQFCRQCHGYGTNEQLGGINPTVF